MKFTEEMIAEDEKRWHARDIVAELGYCSHDMRDRRNITNLDIRFYAYIMRRAYELLKAQEQRHRLEVHNIGNVDIPESVTMEQFHAVMNNVVEALEHTDKGESWPYGEENEI